MRAVILAGPSHTSRQKKPDQQVMLSGFILLAGSKNARFLEPVSSFAGSNADTRECSQR